MTVKDEEFSLKQYFYPLTTIKVIGWITVIGLFAYVFCFFNDFVWDDLPYIVNNPDVYRVNILYLLKENSFNNSLGQYRALTAIYFAVVHAWVGNTPFLYHLLQVGMHIVNSVLVYLVMKVMMRKNIAFFTALLFLIHPIQVESAAYIGATGNSLFFLFGITGLVLAMQNSVKPVKMSVMTGCFVLSLLAKETGGGFLMLAILYQVLFNRKYLIKHIIYGVGAVVIYLIIRLGIGGVYFSKVPVDSIIPMVHLPLGERLLNLPAIVGYYLTAFIFPAKLAVNQLWTVAHADWLHFYFPLILDGLIFAGLTGMGVYIYKKTRDLKAYAFFAIWFLAGLAIHSQIIVLDATVADRWFYFPIVGILGLLGVGLNNLKIKTKMALPIAIVLILILSLRTIVRITDWKNQLILYAHDSQIIDNFDLENSLGNELIKAGKPDEAINHFQKSIQLFAHETNLFNLGLVYEQQKNKTAAEKYYAEALNSRNMAQVPYPHKHREELYVKLAKLVLQHDGAKAGEVISSGLGDYPESAQLWFLKSLDDYSMKNNDGALKAAKQAYALQPKNANIKELYDRLTQNKPINIIYDNP